jgi:hypothetical protein
MSLAAKMMADHAIEEDDIRNESGADGPSYDHAVRSVERGRMASWEKMLAHAVERAIPGVFHYLTALPSSEFGKARRQVMAIAWYGSAERVEAAQALFDETRTVIATMACGRFGGAYRGEGRSYAEGFAVALINKANEAQREHALAERVTAIIRAEEARAKQWLADTRGVRLQRVQSSRGGRHHGHAFGVGKRDGGNHAFGGSDGGGNGGRRLSSAPLPLPGK